MTDQLTLSAGDFPARTRPSQTRQGLALTGKEQASLSKPLDTLGNWEQSGSSWKTSQSCLIEDSAEFLGRWPTAGLMQNGTAYHRAHWVRLTKGNGSLSMPTPAARDGKDLSRTTAYLSQRLRHSPSMATTLLMNGKKWWEVSLFYAAAMGFPSQWNAAVYPNTETRLTPELSDE